MNKKSVLCFASALAAILGCSTIEQACDAQAEVEPASRDDAPRSARKKIDANSLLLSEQVSFAMTNRPTVVRAALAVDAARLALKEIDADAPLVSDKPWLSPHLSAAFSYSERSAGRHASDFRLSTERGSPSASLSLDVLVYDFGRYDARANAQSERVVAAELALAEAGYSVFSEVCDAYFNVLEKRALVEVALTNEVECALHVSHAEERFANGEAKQLDLLRAKLDLAKARELCVSASNNLVIALAEQCKALGLEASDAAPMETAVQSGGDGVLAFVQRGFGDTVFTADEAFVLARTNSPTMRVARAKLRAASADVDYAIANLMPSVTASASIGWTDPLWVWGWGVSAVQSIFEGFRKTTAVDRAVVAMRQAAEDASEVEQRLSRDIELAIAARDNSKVALRTASESFAIARENLELVHKQANLGDASRVDLTDAVADYVVAMGERVSAFYKGQRAEAAIFALTGAYPVYDERRITEDKE